MKIQIALAGSGHGEGVSASGFDHWKTTVEQKPEFDRIERLDSNKMAAYDKQGNILDTFIIDVSHLPQATDTLDSEQVVVPADKTSHDAKIDATLEKGA